MFMHEVQELRALEERWRDYEDTGSLNWWLPKSPQFHSFE
jgi:hypothetical protein